MRASESLVGLFGWLSAATGVAQTSPARRQTRVRMFQSHLSDIVEFQGRAKTATRLFRQFKISCQKIEILARVVDLFLIAATARARSWQVRTLLGQRGLSTDGLSLPVTIQEAPLIAFERAVKRTLDVVGSVTAILFLSPLFLIARSRSSSIAAVLSYSSNGEPDSTRRSLSSSSSGR